MLYRFAGLVSGFAVVMSLLAVTPAATAETKVREDRSGDAPAAIDIDEVEYAYGHGRVSVVASIPDLGRSGQADLTVTRFDTFEAGYVLRIVKRSGDPAKVRLYYFDHFDLNRRRCEDLGGKWRAAGLSVSVPGDCLSGHARRSIRTQVTSVKGREYDRAPAVARLARD